MEERNQVKGFSKQKGRDTGRYYVKDSGDSLV